MEVTSSPCTASDCVYVTLKAQPGTDGYASTATHVDDVCSIGGGEGLRLLEETLTSRGAKFKITKVVNPSVICGVQVQRCRKRGEVLLHQLDYAEDMLTSHNMADCRARSRKSDGSRYGQGSHAAPDR